MKLRGELNKSVIVGTPKVLELNLGSVSPRDFNDSQCEINSYRELASDRHKPARKLIANFDIQKFHNF